MSAYCDQAACPREQCVECKRLEQLASAKSFYVRRVSPEGREGWTGSLRTLYRAEREATAWLNCGWEVEIVPNSPNVRAKVRRWEHEARARRAS